MKYFGLNIMVSLYLSWLTTPAVAETAAPQPDISHPTRTETLKKSTKRKSRRWVASNESRGQESIKITGPQTPTHALKNVELQLGLLLGYANSSTNVSSDQMARDRSGYGRNVYLGINADIRAYQYAAVGVDTFLATGPSRSDSALDKITGNTSSSQKSLRQIGGLFDLKGRLPFSLSTIRLVPQLGLGYGLIGVRQTTTSSASGSDETSNLNLRGPYATVGLEIEPIQDVSIVADYARSISSTGTYEAASGGTTLSSTETASSRFDRIRVGAFYRIIQPITVGAQYNRRNLRYELAGEANARTETLDQIVGVVNFNF